VFLSIMIFYYFVSCFFTSRFERRCALSLILFAPGLGWVFWLMKQYTGTNLDLWLWDIRGINLFGFIMHKPHYVRSLAFVSLSYAFLLKGEETENRMYFFLAGACVIIHGIIRPYNLPVPFLLFVLFPILLCIRERGISMRRTGNYSILILTSSTILVYYLYLYNFTILKDVYRQVSLRPLTPLELIIWLGFPILIGLFSFDGFKDLRHKGKPQVFLCLWFILLLGLIYSYPIIPWGMEGAGPLCMIAPVMAGTTIFKQIIPGVMRCKIGRKIPEKWWATGIVLVVIVCSFPSNVVLIRNSIAKLSQHSRPFYLTNDVADAFEWLRRNSQKDALVMCAAGNGPYLTVLSRVRVFTGFPVFTIDFEGKNRMVKEFFDDTIGDGFRKKLLNDYKVAYLFYSNIERNQGSFNPGGISFLREIYKNPGVTIFKVASDQL